MAHRELSHHLQCWHGCRPPSACQPPNIHTGTAKEKGRSQELEQVLPVSQQVLMSRGRLQGPREGEQRWDLNSASQRVAQLGQRSTCPPQSTAC